MSETQIASRVPTTAPPIRTVVAPEHPRTSTIDAGAFTVSLRNDGGLFRGPPIATTRIRRRPMIQRTRWVYGTDRWAPLRGEPAPATDQPTAVPATDCFEQGDTFDDADTTLQLYSGANAKVLGEPTVFSHGTASPRVVRNMRAALSLAKLKLDKGLAAVQAGELASRSGPIPGRLATVLEVGFNVPHDVSRVELNRILGIVVAGLEKLRTGLASEGLPLVAAANMRAYGVISQRADCSGWVPRGFTEMSGRTTPLEGKHDLTAVSGDIHVRVSDVDKDDFDVSFVSDTVIHEATHKFLGTWDYSYVGAQGSVGRGLQDRSGMQTRAEDPGTWDATKAESAQRAHAQVAQAVVIEGLKPMLPEALDRTRPVRPSDPEGFVAAQKVYAMVSTWGSPQAAPPDADVLAATIALLCQQDALPSKAKSELKRFLSNRETFLAERGNELNVKGHDVLFALPTGYQLKNADSWTEVALTAGT